MIPCSAARRVDRGRVRPIASRPRQRRRQDHGDEVEAELSACHNPSGSRSTAGMLTITP